MLLLIIFKQYNITVLVTNSVLLFILHDIIYCRNIKVGTNPPQGASLALNTILFYDVIGI